MSFYVGDIPSEPFVIEPPETITLDTFDDAAATFRVGTAAPVPLDASISVDTIVVDLPDDGSVFTEPGVGVLRITLTASEGYSQRVPDVRIVIQDPDSEWHTLDSIREEWPDSEHIPDAALWEILQVAEYQVVTFAPLLAEGSPVPTNWRLAQRNQSRNIWNAAKVSPNGTMGQDDYVITPFPLDWHVKQLLRPKRAVGGIA